MAKHDAVPYFDCIIDIIHTSNQSISPIYIIQ